MNEHADDVLAARFAALPTPPDDGDWVAVARTRRRARRPLLAAAIVVAAIAVAAPAFGLHRQILDFFETAPAPEKIRLEFDRYGRGAPPGMDPGVVAGSAREIPLRFSHGTYMLWVAPTADGGFCFRLEHSGSCAPARPKPFDFSRRGDVNAHLIGGPWTADEEGIVSAVGGPLRSPKIERLKAVYADGEEVELEFVWISPPIDAGFFAYEVPERHQTRARALTALVALDADGDVVARRSFPLLDPDDVPRVVTLPDGERAQLPPRALVEQARLLIDFEATNGTRMRLWVIPTRDGGRCWHSNNWAGCPPGSFRQTIPMAYGVVGEGFFVATTRDEVATVELRYRDGAAERVTPVEGFVFHELRAPSQLELAVALDAAGKELQRQPFDPPPR